MSMPALKEFNIRTGKEGFYQITKDISAFVAETGVQEGIAVIFCPHTTAAITINENSDPDVVFDISKALRQYFPDLPEFRHAEGNSGAHLRSSLFTPDRTVIIHKGQLMLGTWQGIYFCEFDGPRERHYFVRVMEG